MMISVKKNGLMTILLIIISVSLFFVVISGITGCSEGGMCGNSTNCGDCGSGDETATTVSTVSPVTTEGSSSET